MSGTTWLPDPEPARRVWLLENGELVEEPELEVSGSHRRVRVKGRQETSVYMKERDTIIQEAVERVATRKRTDILTCLSRSEAIDHEQGDLPEAALDVDGDRVKPITCTWVYRHESLPVTARIQITLRHNYRRQYKVSSQLTFDEVSARSRHQPHTGRVSGGLWDIDMPGRYWDQRSEDLRSALDRSDLDKHFITHTCASEREAIRTLRDQINVFEEREHVQVPDVRDPSNVRWLTLSFQSSNIEGQLLSDLADYLDSEPIVEQVAEKYAELRQLMRYLGLVLDERSPDDFQRAASLGGDDALRVKVSATNPDGTDDHAHSVLLHLATGTITVSCPSRSRISDEQLADSWKLARFEAEMRGELDALMGYYRSMIEDQDRHQVISVINQRSG